MSCLTNILDPHQDVSCCSLGFDEAQKTADYLLERIQHRPRVGIICGTGLGNLANEVANPEVFDYKDIPHFPVSTGRPVYTLRNSRPRLIRIGLFLLIPSKCVVFRFAHVFFFFALFKKNLKIRSFLPKVRLRKITDSNYTGSTVLSTEVLQESEARVHVTHPWEPKSLVQNFPHRNFFFQQTFNWI